MPRPLPIDPPPQIADLPRDGRGYPVPAEVGWTSEGPMLAGMDPLYTTALAFRRACVVCGFALLQGELVWRNFSQKVAAHARIEGREFAVDPGFAGHLSCMLFSAFACPYWASPHGRLGKNSLTTPGAPRGTRPAALGFTDVLYLAGEFNNRPTVPEHPLMGYAGLAEDIPFRDPSDALAAYERAVEADRERIDLQSHRSYWPDAPGTDDDLVAIVTAGKRALARSQPAHFVDVGGEHRMAFRVPLA